MEKRPISDVGREEERAPPTKPLHSATLEVRSSVRPADDDQFKPAVPANAPTENPSSTSTKNAPTTDAAASLSADLKETAQTAGRAVKAQASQLAAEIGHELSKTAESQKGRGVEAIQCLARAMTSAAAELEGQSPGAAQSVRDAAAKVEGFSQNLDNRSVEELMQAATDLARSQPILFMGGAVAAGIALGRFLKSTASNMTSSSERSGP